jgi:hypothetical protein
VCLLFACLRVPVQLTGEAAQVTLNMTSSSLFLLLLAVSAFLCFHCTPVAAQHNVRDGRDVTNVPCIYAYECGKKVVYVGQGGGAGASCKSRLGDHFGGMKGFFALQRTQFPRAGNILADLPVRRGGYFDHDACIAKECIDAWQAAKLTNSAAVLTDVMNLYYINTNQVPVPAKKDLFGNTLTAATTRIVNINDAERSLVRSFAPVCNRKEGGLSGSDAYAINPDHLKWTASTTVSPDDTSILGTSSRILGITSTQSAYPDTVLNALIQERDDLEVERNTLQTDLDGARDFIQSSLDQCIQQATTTSTSVPTGFFTPPITQTTIAFPARTCS